MFLFYALKVQKMAFENMGRSYLGPKEIASCLRFSTLSKDHSSCLPIMRSKALASEAEKLSDNNSATSQFNRSSTYPRSAVV